MKKVILILMMIPLLSFSQIYNDRGAGIIDTTTVRGQTLLFTDTTEVWFGGKKIQGSDLIYSGTEIRLLDMDSINRQIEKQFWKAQKHDLSVIIGEYLKEETPEEKTLIGFYEWLRK